MYFQKRRARAHPRLKSFVCIRCLSSGIFTVWSYYFIRLNLNTRNILPIPWPQATIIELDQLRRSRSLRPSFPFLEYHVEKNCSADPTQLRDTPPLSSSRILFYDKQKEKKKRKGKRRRRRRRIATLFSLIFPTIAGRKASCSETNRARKSELSRGKVNRFVNHVTGTAGVSQAKHWHVQSFRSLHLPYRLDEPTAVHATRVQRATRKRKKTG